VSGYAKGENIFVYYSVSLLRRNVFWQEQGWCNGNKTPHGIFYDLCELWQLTINNWEVKTVQNSDKTYFSEVIKGKIGQTILG